MREAEGAEDACDEQNHCQHIAEPEARLAGGRVGTGRLRRLSRGYARLLLLDQQQEVLENDRANVKRSDIDRIEERARDQQPADER
eukprot:scaffold222399_cov29-Tisochrysis_lutea.AAC.2